MRFFKVILGSFFAYFIFAFFGTTLTSCKKQILHDTTLVTITDTLTIRDTITVKDTVTVIDTLCNLSDGLVAYYNFNGGNLNDSSGYNNNIIFSNATMTTDRLGNPNNAYLFNGDSSYMQVKNSSSIDPNNITIFAIVKVTGFYKGSCYGNEILCKGTPDAINGLYFMRFSPTPTGINCDPNNNDTTRESFYAAFGDNNPQGSAAGAGNVSLFIQPQEWYSLTYTYDGAVSNFYINGALVDSETKTVPFTPNSDDLFIGKNENTLFPYYFNGAIDEIRIYNKAIPGQKIGYLNFMRNKYLKVANKLIY